MAPRQLHHAKGHDPLMSVRPLSKARQARRLIALAAATKRGISPDASIALDGMP